MGRLLRPVEDGLTYHALNRGNNRGDVFTDDADHEAFRETLAKTRERYPFRLLGYCVMTNHFHLLIRPDTGQSISRILQSLTVAHTWRYDKRHRTVGHVWQGRFKSPVIQDDALLLVVLRYIEANPLRAGIVLDLKDYRWSSYEVHGIGRPDPLVSPFPEWESLGKTDPSRQARWRRKLTGPQDTGDLAAVRNSVRTGRPFGSPDWSEATALRLGVDWNPRPRGRPRKSPDSAKN